MKIYGRYLLILSIVLAAWLSGFTASAERHGRSRVRIRKLLPKKFANVIMKPGNLKMLRLGFDRVIVVETFLKNNHFPDFSVRMRQVTDGKRLVQSVIQNGAMKECDFTKDQEQIQEFVDHFMELSDFEQEEFGDILTMYEEEHSDLTAEANLTLANKYFDSAVAPKELSQYLNLRLQRKQCRDFTKMANKVAKKDAKLIRHGEYLNSSDDATNKFNQAIAKRQSELAAIDGTITTGNSVRHINKRSAEQMRRTRSKRAAFDFNSVLIYPGTKWCGKGDLATCFDDLGDDKELDVCCRDHDCCPYVIPPFTSQYGMFNYRFHSLLHCECDQRFRGCLSESPSSTANMIGKIYFNILGSKCFEFEEVDVCVHRTWYGYCKEWGKEVKAMVKPQKAFYDMCSSGNNTTPGSSSSSSSTSSTTMSNEIIP